MTGLIHSHRWSAADQRRLLAALRKPTSSLSRTGSVPVLDVIVLHQPRKTFDGIPELADSIASQGLIYAPSIARLSAAEFDDYLRITNQLWGSTFSVDDFRPAIGDNGQAVYQVLIDGERRLRACHWLWEHGCTECRNGVPLAPGECFTRHFNGAQLDATIYEGIGTIAALNIQYSANTHQPVPLHEEAEAYALFLRLLRQVMPELTVAAFARQVGRSEEWIRRALAFVDTYPEIQDAVRHRHIKFGIGLELARLQRADFSRDEVLYRLQYFLVSGTGQTSQVKEFHQLATKLIADRQNDQRELFGLMTDQQARASRRLVVRRTLAKQFLSEMRGSFEYLRLVLQALDAGEIGRTIATGSARRHTDEVVGILEQIVNHPRPLLTKKQTTRARQVITKYRALRAAERKHRHLVPQP